MDLRFLHILPLVWRVAILLLFALLPFIFTEALIQPTQTAKTFIFLYFLVGISCLFILNILWGNTKAGFHFSKIDLVLFSLFGYIIVNRYLIQNVFSFSFQFYELLGLAVLYVIIRWEFNKNYFWYLLALMAGGLLQALYGNLQLHGFYDSHHPDFAVTGGFFNPGPYAGFLAAVFPIATGLYFYANMIPKSLTWGIVSSPNIKPVNIRVCFISRSLSTFFRIIRLHTLQVSIVRWFSLITMATILLVLPATQSRAGLLAAVVSVAYLIFSRYNVNQTVRNWLNTKTKKNSALVFLIAFLFAGLTTTYWVKKDSADGRILIWQVTNQMFQSYPVSGLGYDRFKANYMEEQSNWFQNHPDSPFVDLAGNTTYAFNDLLQFTVEEGLIGLVLLIFLVIFLFKTNDANNIWLVISKAGLIAISVFALFSYPSQILPIKLCLILFLSIIASYDQTYIIIPASPLRLKFGLKVFVTISLLGAIIYVIVHLNNVFNATKNWKLGLYTYNTIGPPKALEYYARAAPIFGRNGNFLMNYGKALSLAKDNHKALVVLEQARKHLNNTIIQTSLGDSYQQIGKIKEAEQAYQIASDMLPSRFYPKYLLVKLYENSGQWEKTILLAEALIEKKPKIKSLAIEEIKQQMKKTLLKAQSSDIELKLQEQQEKGKNLPFEINKRIVISEKCDRIVYSSNKHGFFNPSTIQGVFTDKNITYTNLLDKQKKDLLPYSISYDCNLISFVSENLETQSFTIYIYNIREKKLFILNQDQKLDNGFPIFSPSGSLLAYLEDANLKLFNFQTNKHIDIPQSIPLPFKNITWSLNGEKIYLQDYTGSIWHYNFEKKKYQLIWETRSPFYTDRLITPIGKGEFYFISDHNSEFNQVYKYESNGSVKLIINSKKDKYLLKHTIGKEIYYRENNDGYFLLKKGKNENLLVKNLRKGVVYDAYPFQKNKLVYLYSSLNTPASIFISSIRGDKSKEMLNNDQKTSIKIHNKIIKVNGVNHILYQSNSKVQEEKWILWFHGGPHEQMSPRYNVYINNLVQAGYGVIALNYPGSTGAGNSYEMRNLDRNELIKRQLKSIEFDVNYIDALYPNLKLNDFYAVGISYGSILAHRIAAQGNLKITKLVDFSGLYDDLNHIAKIPKLYIYGRYDFALESESRVNLITTDTEILNNKRLVIPNEGHIINHYRNIDIILDNIIYFFEER